MSPEEGRTSEEVPQWGVHKNRRQRLPPATSVGIIALHSGYAALRGTEESLLLGSELASLVKERFSAPLRSKFFRFLHLLRRGAIVPMTITTTANAIRTQKDAPLAGLVGRVTAVAGALAVSEDVLAVSAGVASTAAGVLEGVAGEVASAAGVAGCF